MDNKKTHLSILLDRSGSMSSCWNDTIGGLETFFQEQKNVEGEMTTSIATFDTEYNKPYDFVDIKSIKSLSGIATPRGGTALYDSFCRLVDETGARLASLPEAQRPGKVIFVVVTDGGENSSREFRYEQVKSRLDEQKNKYSWNFTFLGADFDANALGRSFNLSSLESANYAKGSELKTFGALSASVRSYRGKSSALMDEEDRLIMKSVESGPTA